ncbi:uncharacterized protein L203_102411 [Cryptococcus depauperatus CBS 7841]|uniref:Uncharacterized protein n=1 Tax=Cryptococcus depauperatus CBS 7841 TaxID=1295531 RepID=A0A1E3IAI9_9TREE|nr:hypothetical protein L203_04870 [Cryptococcus depauperatus CBS 7841]
MSSPFPIHQFAHSPSPHHPSPLSQFAASALANNLISTGSASGNTPQALSITPNVNMGFTPTNTSSTQLSAPLLMPSLSFSNLQGPLGHDEVVQIGEGDKLARELDAADSILVRMEELVGEIRRLESQVFNKESEIGKLEGLHLEYTQLLLSLLSSSQNNLSAALPVLKTTQGETAPSIEELTKWAGDRAALEFSRREALRAGGRAVLDILRGSGAK